MYDTGFDLHALCFMVDNYLAATDGNSVPHKWYTASTIFWYPTIILQIDHVALDLIQITSTSRSRPWKFQ